MQILDYKHIVPTEKREGYFAIPELDRTASAVNQFIELADLNIELKVPTGVIYVDGFSVTQSEMGLGATKPTGYKVAICSGTSYALHKWIASFKNPEMVTAGTSTSGTCASGIEALNIANEWIATGVCEEVIVIGGERITQDTIRAFRELKIPVICGDGFVYMKFGKGTDITNTNWYYAYNKNPFVFEKEVLNNLIPHYEVDYVKLHSTGTDANNNAESDLMKLGKVLAYKDKIGHSQGISSILEMCIVLSDESIKGKILFIASGVGGFYGSCILHR